MPMDKILLATGDPQRHVTLTEYLRHFADYLHRPSDWANEETKSLLAGERDANVIVSPQACFLPVAEDDRGKTEFNVHLYNYQTREDSAAVLAIVATAQGTSAQLVTDGSRKGQVLDMNVDGKHAPLVAQLLSTYRRAEKGITDKAALEAPLQQDEAERNVVLIIQVPLRQKKPIPVPADEIEQCCDVDFDESEEECRIPEGAFRGMPPPRSTTRDAIVGIGAATDRPFQELADGQRIERDPRFPVRVTFQFYKTTSTGVADKDDMQMISGQFAALRKRTKAAPGAVGSLVTGPTEGRTTAPILKVARPAWWPNVFATLRATRALSSLTDEEIADKVFRNGRFMRDKTPDDALAYVMRHLIPSPEAEKAQQRKWGSWM